MEDLGNSLRVALTLVSGLDHELVGIVALSLRVSLSATAVAFVVGVPLGALLAIGRFRGRSAIIVVANALLGLPPVVAGLFVYIMLSRAGPLGPLGLLFTPAAMIVAQSMLGLPIVVALSHRAIGPLWDRHGESLRVSGASRLQAGVVVTRMARAALTTVFLAAFGRAIAEVGAILVVGGNIRGVTRTMTTAIALETSKGDLALALGLGLVLMAISLAVSTVAFGLERWSRTG